jgi:hypothetical protein
VIDKEENHRTEENTFCARVNFKALREVSSEVIFVFEYFEDLY